MTDVNDGNIDVVIEQWFKRTTDKQVGGEVLRDMGVGSASLPFFE